ncbi:NAD(P)-binding protein [Durotheca rogersii]|uniref:NAD(P)-binding protein n=1 Tax=Durotheca rogersii TaxID=419775 RepID=UPI0022203D4A|nr:NAD(P)-binding protein [Durotheca rogersii]KAI5862252.1 NAD(P)-binding protein [Durotheca rogersii]
MASVFQPGNTAVITGGASGIGRALARRCAARHGMRVLVVDWAVPGTAAEGAQEQEQEQEQGQEAAIAAAVVAPEPNDDDEEPPLPPGSVSAVRADVSKPEDWARVRDRVEREFGGQINLLALNAGVGAASSFGGTGLSAAFRRVFDANVFGVVEGLEALLPLVRARAAAAAAAGAPDDDDYQAALVLTGSKQGITNPPGSPAYNASKAAVKAVAEQLSYELRGLAGVGVHLLVPGWTWTKLAGAGAPGAARPPPGTGPWAPAQVAAFLEERVRARRFWVLCPDYDVSEEVDRKRMLWTADDAVKGRPPLSRWRDEYKDEFAAWMAKDL